jgi:FAD/FMN-containing dehydrogenase
VTEFQGRFVRRGEAGFTEACVSRVFNQRRQERWPAAVLAAASPADVAAGVRLARRNGWKVTVRSGGHSWAVWSLLEDALLIDLASFTGISYDAATGVVTAGPAVRGGSDLDPFLARHGRFFAGGHCPTVGLGGFLLQGGMGWNCRGWGWAAESIVAMDVVTAEGELVRCSETENEDLFWAARGSGPGFFGVVTAFHLRTRQRFESLTQTTHVYPIEFAEEVLSWLHTARHDVPDCVELVAVGITPPLPPGVGYSGPTLVLDGVSFDGGAQSLAALQTCPVADKALVKKIAEPVEIADLRAEQIRANPEGHRYVVDNAYLAGKTADLIPALTPAFTELPTPQAFSLWFDLAHLPGRNLPDMALSLQTDLYFASYVVCEDPADDDRCTQWVQDTMQRLEPYSPGRYLGDSDLQRRAAPFLTEPSHQRLEAIRGRRDPDGLFPGYPGQRTTTRMTGAIHGGSEGL